MNLSDLAKRDITVNVRFARIGILALLAVSLDCLMCAPMLMSESYSWISNAISESAAQGIHSAWLARLGFVVYGFAVIWLVDELRGRWGVGARYCHLSFGILMVAVAAFSIRPWDSGAMFDATEDFLHSFLATAMGFAYTFGVVMVFLQRKKTELRGRIFDVVAATVATLFPLLMLAEPEIQGLVQRTMFLVSYVWFAKEGMSLRGSEKT